MLRHPRLSLARTLTVLAVSLAIYLLASAADPSSSAARSAALTSQASVLAEAFTNRFGQGYTAQIDAQRHIVYVSALDGAGIAQVAKVLGAYYDYQQKALFPQPLQQNVVVILPTVSDYKKLPHPPEAMGVYNARTHVLASISLSNVLIHEFTHALHHNDQELAAQEHPIWLLEGLASLFQGAIANKDGAWEPLIDATLADLQRAMAEQKSDSLAKLLTMSRQDFLKDPNRTYVEARYLLLYLARSGRLESFYAAYKAGYEQDRTGQAALESILAKPLDAIESDWKQWVLAQKAPWMPATAPSAHLGIKMARAPGGLGVEVTALLKNSPAEKSGLIQPRDVIVSVANQPTPDPQALTAAIRTCRPGEIVEIELFRGEQKLLVKQLLDKSRN